MTDSICPTTRRRILKTIGASGTIPTVPAARGAPQLRSSGRSSPGDSVDTFDAATLVEELVSELASRAASAILEWMNSVDPEHVVDTLEDILGSAFDTISYLRHLDRLVNSGDEVETRIQEAETIDNSCNITQSPSGGQTPPPNCEEYLDEEDGDESDGGETDDEDDSELGSSPSGGQQPTASVGTATSAASAAGSSAGAQWGAVKSTASSIADGFSDLSNSAREYVEDGFDWAVNTFVDLVGQGVEWLLEQAAEAIGPLLAAPANALTDIVDDLADTSFSDLDLDWNLGFDEISFDFPFELGVVGPDQLFADDVGSATASAAAAGSASSSGVDTTAAGGIGRNTAGDSPAGSGTTAGAVPRPDPEPDLDQELEEAYRDVSSVIGEETDLVFEQRQCVGAPTPVETIGYEFGFQDPVGDTDVSLTFWVGHETGQPCTYWGVDPNLNVEVDARDYGSAIVSSQTERIALLSVLESVVEEYADAIEAIVEQPEEATFGETEAILEDLETELQEREAMLDDQLTLAVPGTFDDVGIPEVRSECKEVADLVESARTSLRDSDLLDRLVTLSNDLGEGDRPPELERIADAAGSIVRGEVDVEDVTLDIPGRLQENADAVGNWLQRLDPQRRRELARQTTVDLDRLEEDLTDVDRPAFDIGETAQQRIEELDETLDGLLDTLDGAFQIQLSIDDYWPEPGCMRVCGPQLGRPSSVGDIVDTSVEVGSSFADWLIDWLVDQWESLPDWLQKILIVIAVVVLVVLVILGIKIILAKLGILGTAKITASGVKTAGGTSLFSTASTGTMIRGIGSRASPLVAQAARQHGVRISQRYAGSLTRTGTRAGQVRKPGPTPTPSP